MTDLEQRIRETLQDPRRMLPVWPDPMPRIRRAARRRWAGLAATTMAAALIVAAGVAAPLAALSGKTAHRFSPPKAGSHAAGAPSWRAVGSSFRPSSLPGGSPLAPWTKQLRGEVAYKCADSICLMRPDGGRHVTFTATFPEWDPAWSPNGGELAFRGYYGTAQGDYGLYVVDIGRCRLLKLASATNGTSPSWSPTGRQIAFSVGGINVVNADGSGFRRLTVDGSTYADDSATWSMGNRIAFVRTRMGAQHGEIYIMNADGSGLGPLTHGTPRFGQPSWSPDGKSIAFVAYSGSSSVIEVARSDGTGMHPVSPPSWTSFSPTWTPDGKVVFLVQGDVRTSAYVVNAGGTGLRLYASLQDALQIAWGPKPLPRAC